MRRLKWCVMEKLPAVSESKILEVVDFYFILRLQCISLFQKHQRVKSVLRQMSGRTAR
jgi:hypothetical protein